VALVVFLMISLAILFTIFKTCAKIITQHLVKANTVQPTLGI
jgi:hypothetical protein